MRVDPNASGGGMPHPGTKIAHAVGFHRWTSSRGNPMISVAFVIVADPENQGDEGATFTERFTITEKALARLSAWAVATGYAQPWDSDDDDKLGEICALGAVQVKLVEDEYQGETRIVPGNWPFSRYTGPADESWDAIVARAEANYQRRMAERSSFGGGGGGGSRPSATTTRGNDDDIPFARACNGEPSWVAALVGEARFPWQSPF
jgi:hypothetical protein